MADVQRVWGSQTIDNDLTVGALAAGGTLYSGSSVTTGTTRTWQAQGTEANITLQVVPKGTGTFRVPTGYEANIADGRDIVNKAWTDAHIANKEVSATLTGAGASEDGYVIVWDDTNSVFDLVASSGGHVIEDEGTPVTQRSNLNFTGAGVSVADAGGKTVVTIGGGGGVSSVGLTGIASLINVGNSPITGSGDMSLSLATQTANFGFWGPVSGSAALPTFRRQVVADLPFLEFDDVPGTTYLFAESDNHRVKRFTNSLGCTATIPVGLTVGWETLAYRALNAGPLIFQSNGTYEAVSNTLSIEKTAAAIMHRGGNIHVAVGAFGEGLGTPNQILATNNAGTIREWKTLETSTTAVSNNVGVTLTTADKIIINIPNASLTNRGVIDTGSQTIQGNKLFIQNLTVGNPGVDGVVLVNSQGIVRLYSASVSTDIGLSTATTHLYTTLGWQSPSIKFTSSGNTADGSAASISGAGGTMNLSATTFQLNGVAASSPTLMFMRGDGTWAVPPGGGGSSSSVLDVNTTSVGNVGTGEDVLYTYTLPAATLASNDDFIRGRLSGIVASNGNLKTIKLKFGGTTFLTRGTTTPVIGQGWIIDWEVIRTGATSQKCNATFSGSDGVVSAYYSTAGETLSGTVDIVLTGEATATDDIIKHSSIVSFGVPGGGGGGGGDVSVADFVTSETPTGAVDGVNDIFTLANVPVSFLHFYKMGILQKGGGVDYTIVGDTITTTTPPAISSILSASYLK